MRKKLFLVLTILTPALILAPNVLAQSPTPSPQVNVNVNVSDSGSSGNTNVNTNTNTNNINIQNSQTQTVTVGTAVPRVLPATGTSPWTTVAMLGAIPLGLYLRKYKGR